MATKLGVNSLNNNVNIYYLSADPSSDGIGFPAAIGSIAIFENAEGQGRNATKFGAGDTQWATINPFFGGGYQQAEELGEESTSSSIYVEKYLATFTATQNARYYLISYCEIKGGSSNNSRNAQSETNYRINAGAYTQFGEHDATTNKYDGKISVSDALLSIGDVLDIQINFKRSGNTTAFMRRNKVIIYAVSAT